MTELYAVIALSYGFRSDGSPCLSNIDLAREADRLSLRGLVVIAQHEIAELMNEPVSYTIRKHSIQGRYLDSDEMNRQALEWLKEQHVDIREIGVVAQPFLHLTLSQMLVQRRGYKVHPIKIGPIRFDTRSAQWWTRSRLASVLYLIRRVFFNVRGR